MLLLITAGTLVTFLAWWFRGGHAPHNFHGGWHAVDFLLFIALTSVFAHRLFMDVFSWTVAWGMRQQDPPPPPQPGLRVAFITTFVPGSEPLELLQRTLPAMIAADYPHDVWVLDEGDDGDARALCTALGVRHFSRRGVPGWNQPDGEFAIRTKGGNHNSWYVAFGRHYDVVAQIDTDFVPRRDFLTKTLGYFRDPKIGWVGTPQVYGNTGQSRIARGAAQQLYAFYGHLLRGFGGREQCCLIGANHVIRVRALWDIGWYAGHLTEDLLTGMRLHAAGWRSRYVAEPLAVGEGPSTWSAYFNQQNRWAFGCMDVLRSHSLPLTRRMRWRTAGLYLALQQFYFTGVASLIGMALLASYFLGGLYPADVPVVSTVLWSLPLLLMRQVVALWLQRFSPKGVSERGLLLHGRLAAALVWPVYLVAFFGVVRGQRLVFRVTPKGRASREGATPLAVVLPQLTVGLLSVCLLAAGFAWHRTALSLTFWAGLNATLMLGFVAVALLAGRLPRRPTAPSWVIPQQRRAISRSGPVSHRRPTSGRLRGTPVTHIDLTAHDVVAATERR